MQDAISILGEPEVYLTEGALDDTSSSSKKYSKKLFRSEDDQKISGVCGGLAIYFGVDSSKMRLLMIFFFIITASYGALAYIIYGRYYLLLQLQPIS